MIINSAEGREYPLWRHAALYSELEEKLNKLIELYPNQIRIEKIGKSHEGKDLLLVMLSDCIGVDSIAEYQKFRDVAFNDPQKIRTEIEQGCNYKIPVFFNANLHGNEISGTDGMLSLIQYLLIADEGKRILKAVQITIAICSNPDGRGRGLDIFNGHGFDLNRDWTCQSQPETRAIVSGVLCRFLPVIMLDFHGFMSSNNVLIEPCTPPHNPNYEYDLLQEHAIKNARMMAQEVTDNLRLKCDIPALTMEDGWEDYGPVCTPQFFMYFGSISHTIETNYPNEEGAAVTYFCALGALKYAVENKKALLINQCEYFLRGIKNTQLSVPIPKYYVIPNEKNSQRDLKLVRAKIEHLLNNKIRVYKGIQDNSYIIPTAQPLKGLINTLLWQGEDINNKVKTMYDLSFYSIPVMSGINVIGKDQLPAEEELNQIFQTEHVSGVMAPKDDRPYLRFSSETGDSIAMANLLMGQDKEVYRCTTSFDQCAPGDFLVKNGEASDIIKEFIKVNNVDVSDTDFPEQAYKLNIQRIIIVADSPGSYEVLKEWGFDVTFLPFSELNRGYLIDPEKFDLLIFGGTEAGIWRDVYDDLLGNGFGVSWALRDRGRDLLIEAAKQFKNVICFGFAGAKLNQVLGYLNTGFDYDKGITGDPGATHTSDSQAVGSGSFKMRLDPMNPLCYGYYKDEIIYAVGPVWFKNIIDGKIAGYYADQSFINGFYQNKEEIDNQPAMLYKKDAAGTIVLLGIDPCFRKYTDFTFRILANAVYLAGSSLIY